MFNRRQRYGDRRQGILEASSTGDRRSRRIDRRNRTPERRSRVTDRRSIKDISWLGPFDRRYRLLDRRRKGSI